MDFKNLVFLCLALFGLSGCGCTLWENIDERNFVIDGKEITVQLKTFNRCHAASGRNFMDWSTNHLAFSATYGEEQTTFFNSKPNWTGRYMKSKRFWSDIETTHDIKGGRLKILHSSETKNTNWSFFVSFSPLMFVREGTK